MFGVGQGYQGDTVFFRTKCRIAKFIAKTSNNTCVVNYLTRNQVVCAELNNEELSAHFTVDRPDSARKAKIRQTRSRPERLRAFVLIITAVTDAFGSSLTLIPRILKFANREIPKQGVV